MTNGYDVKEKSRAGTGLLLVLATAIVSGVSTYVNIYAVQGTNSDAFVTVRNLVVAAAIIPMAALTFGHARKRLSPGNWGRLAIIGLVGGAVPFLLFFHGIELATAARGGPTASFIYRSLFLMATVLGVVFLGERIRVRFLAGAIVLLAGNALLLSLISPIWVNGTGYVLAATTLWAAEYTISKATLRDLSSGTVALGRMGFGALFLVAYLAVTNQLAAVGHFTSGQWIWVGVSAAFLTVFVSTWYAGLARVGLAVATSALVLGFPVTYLLAVSFSNFPPTITELLGIVAIVAGVAIVIGRRLSRETWDVVIRALTLRRTQTQ
jgi:drug/metabolite transporter (DMT)-like permease